MKKFYIKKASKQDTDRTLVVNVGAGKKFFCLPQMKWHDKLPVLVRHLPGTKYIKIEFVKKQDLRLLIKQMKSDIKEGDVLVFSAKGKNHFDLETLKPGSTRYRVYELALPEGRSRFLVTDTLPHAGPLSPAGLKDKEGEDDDHEADLLASGSTKRAAVIQARRGQGLFRRRVEKREASCRVTHVNDPVYLRASHIKPWRKSTDKEKLDGNNGLMLSPHIDMLFD